MAGEKTTTPSTKSPPPGAVRLLSLDGGGVKGISSLMVLDAIMKRVREIEKKPHDPEQHFPHEYFDLAGGTSTGGLGALMMFRLKLSTTATIKNYNDMSKQIFSPTLGPINLHEYGWPGYYLGNGVLKAKTVLGYAGFSAGPLESAVDKVVKASGIQKGGKAPLVDNNAPKM